MAARGEEELICDFAETYHVYDWRALPLKLSATLAAGLSDESRIKRKLSGQRVPTDTLLLARIVDQLAIWLWANSEDRKYNRNRPRSVFDLLTRAQPERQKIKRFRTGADFDRAMRKFIRG